MTKFCRKTRENHENKARYGFYGKTGVLALALARGKFAFPSLRA